MTTSAKGRSLELYFIDGRPDGMLTAELFNWTGHILMTPRTQIGEALKRKEASYVGVYLLIGERDITPLLYIGEAEDVSERIRNHDTKKDWWHTAVLITSAANLLNKAHAKYLEARLIEEATAVGKITLENGNHPARPGLSESALSNMETFLENIFLVLPALRIDSFLKNTRPSLPTDIERKTTTKIPVFELRTPKHGLNATAKLEEGEFIVLAGSSARLAWEGRGGEHTYNHLHEELVRIGILQEAGTHRVFSENYAFTSPSAAAAVINGRPANGTTAWKVQGQDKTYKQWEAEQLSK